MAASMSWALENLEPILAHTNAHDLSRLYAMHYASDLTSRALGVPNANVGFRPKEALAVQLYHDAGGTILPGE